MGDVHIFDSKPFPGYASIHHPTLGHRGIFHPPYRWNGGDYTTKGKPECWQVAFWRTNTSFSKQDVSLLLRGLRAHGVDADSANIGIDRIDWHLWPVASPDRMLWHEFTEPLRQAILAMPDLTMCAFPYGAFCTGNAKAAPCNQLAQADALRGTDGTSLVWDAKHPAPPPRATGMRNGLDQAIRWCSYGSPHACTIDMGLIHRSDRWPVTLSTYGMHGGHPSTDGAKRGSPLYVNRQPHR